MRREDRYVATIGRSTERTSLGIAAGRYEYRSVASQHLEQTRHALTGTISHASSPTSKIIYDVSVGRIKDYTTTESYKALYRGGVRFEYTPSENLTIGLQYRYANVYSPDVYEDNYQNDRFILDIKKEF
jgi:opacity protein-like surface antigen